MRRMIVFALAALGVFAASGGMASTAGAQAGGWQIPGASTEVAVYANWIAYHMNIHHIYLSPNPGELAEAEPLYVVVFPTYPLSLTTLCPFAGDPCPPPSHSC